MSSKEQLKFSIITRIYNSEKNLKESIESVLNQTYSNWELVLVDDGSTDSSSQICDDYARKDKRIKVVHQSNQGGAQAELTGYDNCTGDYIFTLDSDDTFEKNTLEFCYNKFTEHPDIDILLFGINQYSEDGILIKKQPFIDKDTYFSKEEFIEYVLRTTVHSLIKVLRKNIVTYSSEELLFFKENSHVFSLNNDILLGFPVLFNANKTLVIPECFYNYKVMPCSGSHINKPYNKIKVALDTFDYLISLFIKQKALNELFSRLIAAEIIREMVGNISLIFTTNNFDKEKIKEIKTDKRFKEVYLLAKQYKLLKAYRILTQIRFYYFAKIL